VKQQLRQALEEAARRVARDGCCALEGLPAFWVERPADPVLGDYATNLALVLARERREPPHPVAEDLAAALAAESDLCDKVAVAGPGFLNVAFRPNFLRAVVRRVLAEEAAYGSCEGLRGQRITIEFPAADPGGPLHFGRGAAIGEVLANLMVAAKAEVSTRGHPSGRVDRVVRIQGPDCPTDRRMAAGASPSQDSLAYGEVRLVRSGEPVLALRRGDGLLALEELIDEVGSETARFFFLLRSPDSWLDFDVDLATAESERNPLYFAQSAHARVCGVLRAAATRGLAAGDADLSPLSGTQEVALIRKIADLPDEIRGGALQNQPHRLTRYAVELAAALHAFHAECCVLGDNKGVSAARVCLTEAAGIALQNTLRLLAITAPERM